MSKRLFVVVGGKGGVGATTIAMKLAEGLPASGARVLVDADLAGKRSAAVSYDLEADLDSSRLHGWPATANTRTGLLVMELARTYEDGFLLTPDSVADPIRRCAHDALIVVDAPQPFAAGVRHFLASAWRIVVVTEPTRLGVGGASATFAAMARFGVPFSHLAFVLNHARGNGELQRSDIESALGTAVDVELPHENDPAFDPTFGDFIAVLAGARPIVPSIGPQ